MTHKRRWFPFTYMMGVIAAGLGFILTGCGRHANIQPCIDEGLSYSDKGDFSSSIWTLQGCLDSITEDHPRYADIYEIILVNYDMRAVDAMRKGEYFNAVSDFEKELAMAGDAATDINQERLNTVRLSLSMSYYYVGRYDEAITHAAMTTPASREDEALQFAILGKAYSAKGDSIQARTYVEKLKSLGEYETAQEIENEIEGRAW